MFHTTCLHRNSMNLSVSTSGSLCEGILVLEVIFTWLGNSLETCVDHHGGGVTCARLGDLDKLLLSSSK